MVGVPSAKGCVTCKKQKKKCIGDTPPCERCKRLRIPCQGLGEKRFSFRDETARVSSKARGETAVVSRTTSRAPSEAGSNPQIDPFEFDFDSLTVEDYANLSGVTHLTSSSATPVSKCSPLTPRIAFLQQNIPCLRTIPTNDIERVIHAFANNIDPSISSGIQLLWNFGPFLLDIPGRLGHNPALDASVQSLLAAYAFFKARKQHALIVPKERSMRAYEKALRALRNTLSEPAQASNPETLASTMLLLIVEALHGPSGGRLLSHAGGAAGILKAKGTKNARDGFEARILLSLRSPVIMQALSVSHSMFTDEEWRDIAFNQHDFDDVDGAVFNAMAQLPNLLLGVRAAWSARPIDYPSLNAAAERLRTLRNESILNRVKTIHRLETLDLVLASERGLAPEKIVLHGHSIRGASMAVTVEMLLNLILCGAVGPVGAEAVSNEGKDVVKDYLLMADAGARESLALAEKADQHRPLGTIYMGFVLRTARAAALDEGLEEALLEKLLLYTDDIDAGRGFLSKTDLETVRDWLGSRDLRRIVDGDMALSLRRGEDKGYMLF